MASVGVTGGDQGDDEDVFTEMLVTKSPGPVPAREAEAGPSGKLTQ